MHAFCTALLLCQLSVFIIIVLILYWGSAKMEADSEEQRLKQVIHYTTGQICEEVNQETGIVFSKQSIATLAEIAYRQSKSFATDAEMFAHHARRKKIAADDVLMLARKTPSLHNHLSSLKK